MDTKTYNRLNEMYDQSKMFEYFDIVLVISSITALAILFFLFRYAMGPKKKKFNVNPDDVEDQNEES